MKFGIMAILLGVFSVAHASELCSPQEVWQHHIESWESRNLDDIVSDYSPESLLIVNNRIYIGKDAIRKVFSRLFEIFDNGKNSIDLPTLKDRIVYITWHFTPHNDSEYFGTDTFVIENGKITVQTIASPLYEKYSERK